jgi:uncharacterized protein
MTASDHKRALEVAFAGLSQGDPRAFVGLMSDSFVWEIPGTSAWSGRWEGKTTVRERLFAPLFERFEGTYTNRALRFIADGDLVVVECRGAVSTKTGGRYDNTYCYICRFEGDQLVELTEYMDTALAEKALGPPADRALPPSR